MMNFYSKKSKGRLVAVMTAAVMIVLLAATGLLLNAEAIRSDLYVSGHGTEYNDITATTNITLSKGQVWTGKNVTDNNWSNGEFSVTFMAVGCLGESDEFGEPYSSGAELIDGRLEFFDRYSPDFNFVGSETAIPITLDGAEVEATLTGGTRYEYNGGEYTVIFDTAARTVNFYIDEWALKAHSTVNITEASYRSLCNTLSFGLILRSDALAGTYKTNEPGSCSVKFTVPKTNIYYFKTEEKLTSYKFQTFNIVLDLKERKILKVEFLFGGGIYDITNAVNDEIGSPVLFNGDYAYKVTVPAKLFENIDSTYKGIHNLDINTQYDVYVINPGDDIAQENIPVSGTAYRSFDDLGSFLVTTEPKINGDFVEVIVGTDKGLMTYSGICENHTNKVGSVPPYVKWTQWTFICNMEENTGSEKIIHNYSVERIDYKTLDVLYNGYWQKGADTSGEVTHTHDALGFITLNPYSHPPTTEPPTTEPPTESPPPAPPSPTVAGDSDVEPSPAVAGETEKLPQTGGISASTMIGIIGLALVAAGGVVFVIANRSKRYI